MNESSAHETRIAQFAQLARNYQKRPGKQFAALLPHRESIVELRSKGASFDAIAAMFNDVQLKVSTDTIRRFYREVVEERVKGKPTKQGGKVSAKPAMSNVSADTLSPGNPASSQSQAAQKSIVPPAPIAEVPRSRGPRIADASKF